MACRGAKDRQKARRFQYHGARKIGPGGTEESAPEIGRGDIAFPCGAALGQRLVGRGASVTAQDNLSPLPCPGHGIRCHRSEAVRIDCKASICNPRGVAEIDGTIVGRVYGAVVNRTENEFNPGDSYLYIYQIGVNDGARRQGAGTALITFTRDWARAFGLKSYKAITGHSMGAQETSSRHAGSRP
jgi:hypothetical protein